MSKKANAGELRTRIKIMRRFPVTDENGFDKEHYRNIYGKNAVVFVKWIGNHGSEVFNADGYAELRRATVTMRYSPLADDGRLVVFREGDKQPWEIVNVDNVGMCNEWLELSLEKRIQAR